MQVKDMHITRNNNNKPKEDQKAFISLYQHNNQYKHNENNANIVSNSAKILFMIQISFFMFSNLIHLYRMKDKNQMNQILYKLLQASKFGKVKRSLAFELMKNCGGTNREGYIGIQDHGDDIWFRNIKI